MKKIPFIALFAASSMLVFSCNKDETVEPEIEFVDEFSELTPEENKAKLEDNGIELIREMEGLKDVSAIETAVNLANLLSYLGDSEASAGGRMMHSFRSLQEGTGSPKEIFSTMRLAADVPSGDPQSIQEFFDTYAGTYNWVAASEEWSYTEGGKDVIFKFPATESGSTNNAVFSMRDYQGTTISNPIEESYSGDLPTRLVMDMTVDGSKVMDYRFAATYNSAGEPASLDISLTLAPYTFTIQQAYTAEAANIDYSLKKDAKLLMAFGANTKGNNFDADNLSHGEPQEIVEEVSAYFQLMNIKIAGTVDVKNLTDGLAQIDYENDAEAVQKEVDLYNQHYKLQVYYADSKLKIADTEFYYYTGVSEWSGEEYEAVELRLVFADDSKSDLETYFNTGFDGFIEELNAFFDNLGA